MIIFILILFCIFMIVLAHWEAELIKEGDSDHKWKTLMLISLCGFPFLFWFEASIRNIFIDTIAMACLYFGMYDYILNLIRKVPDPFNYKLFGKPWMKALALFDTIGLIILYYILWTK